MDQNISLVSINNLLNNTIPDNNNNKYLSLLNKYRKFLAMVCLNCKCEQIELINTNGNQLFEKCSQLEKEYKNLLNHNINSEHQNENSLNSVVNCNSKRIKCESSEECDEIIVIEDSDEPIIDATEHNLDNNTRNTRSNAAKRKNNNRTKNKNKNKRNNNNKHSNDCNFSSEEKIYNDHIIDIETEEKVLSNYYLRKLVSKKLRPKNSVIVGYLCKYGECDYIIGDIKIAYKHITDVHHIFRPFKCDSCNHYSETIVLLRTHKSQCTNKLMGAKRIFMTGDNKDNPFFTRVELRDQTAGFMCRKQKCVFFSRVITAVIKHYKLLHYDDNRGSAASVSSECSGLSEEISYNGVYRKQKLFRDHILDLETYDKNDGTKIANIVSAKPDLKNKIIGYRCVWDNCLYKCGKRRKIEFHIEAKHESIE